MNISIEDFSKLDIRIGKIISAEKIEGTDKLLRLEVDFGPAKQDSLEREVRQIVSGIAQVYAPESLIGKQCPFIVNLERRVIRGLESQGMILAVMFEEKPVLLHPEKDVREGSKIQ